MTTQDSPHASLSALITRLTELEAKATRGEWSVESGGVWLKNPEGAEDWFMAQFNKIEDEKLIVELRNNCKTLLALSRWSLEARESLEVVKMSDIAELSRSEAADALARFPLPHAQ